MTPFISTLSEMRVRGRTTQLAPSTHFFRDVFSATMQLSPTAHSVICVERIVEFGLMSGGGMVERTLASRSLQNIFSHTLKICGAWREDCGRTVKNKNLFKRNVGNSVDDPVDNYKINPDYNNSNIDAYSTWKHMLISQSKIKAWTCSSIYYNSNRTTLPSLPQMVEIRNDIKFYLRSIFVLGLMVPVSLCAISVRFWCGQWIHDFLLNTIRYIL